MTNSLNYLGLFLSVVLGVLNLYQFWRDRFRRPNIVTLKAIMESLTEMCKDAEERQVQNDPNSTVQFIKAVELQTLSAKRSLDTLLPEKEEAGK